MKVKKWILDNISFMDKNILLKIKIYNSNNPLDEVNFHIVDFKYIENKNKHILKKKILKINNTNKDVLEMIVV